MHSSVKNTLLLCLAFTFQALVVEAATDQPKGDFRNCTAVSPECPVEATLYGYYPNLAANAFFTALFALCGLATILIGLFTKTWTYTLALSIGALLEAAGYGGRILMKSDPWSESGLKLQICCLVIAPSFIAAAIYLTLKHLVLYCGPQHSLLPARLYPWIFVGCDFGSIVLQGIGGGMASATGPNRANIINMGNDFIMAGIAFQVITMVVCGVLVLIFVYRYRKARAASTALAPEKSNYQLDKEQGSVPRGKVRLFGCAVVLAYTTVLIRCIFRLDEMSGGWGNALMRNERMFLLLDGMMVAIACVVLTVVHPAFFFPPFAAFRQRRGT